MIKQVCLSIFCLVAALSARSQNWGGGVDEDVLHFGFTFQYLTAEYKVFKKEDWRRPAYDTQTGNLIEPEPFAISSPKAPGFGLGFVSDLKLAQHANLRFTPVLVFSDRLLDFDYGENGFMQKKTQATMVDLPLGFKFKSDRQNNFRAYLLAGAKYSVDIISKKKSDNSNIPGLRDKLVMNKRNFFSYEAGIGLDLYFEFFKLSPEIKFSQSFTDILRRDKEDVNNAYSQPLDKLFLRNFQFSLFFE